MAQEKEARTNGEITAREVRLIDEKGEQSGIVPLRDALRRAEEAELDLVEISPTAKPPVCKIMDFGKYKYEQSKRQDEARKKQRQNQSQIKEIKFRANTDVGDYEVKMRNIKRFLADGDKVKVTLRFRGREMAHQHLGTELLKRVEQDVVDEAQVEQHARLEGRQMVMMLAPLRKK